ncbi:hypothetical protein H5410_044823 [Solanum commersonii]|uniref:Uncharacterized protein n=1 Tax=Solanum commersonii TaxID=4109 RepID=A0A9J5XA14_SOLCO|nr:hypothetical protein H5410_044823 [Solanum commersonii]
MRRNNILAQIGNQKLIASNIAEAYTSTSEINIEHPMYKEFMNFIQSRQVQGNNPPSYSSAVADEGNENIEVFDKNEKDEIMTRYFDTSSFAVPTYKYRMHYEIILSSIGSAEFQHFYPANTKKGPGYVTAQDIILPPYAKIADNTQQKKTKLANEINKFKEKLQLEGELEEKEENNQDNLPEIRIDEINNDDLDEQHSETSETYTKLLTNIDNTKNLEVNAGDIDMDEKPNTSGIKNPKNLKYYNTNYEQNDKEKVI